MVLVSNDIYKVDVFMITNVNISISGLFVDFITYFINLFFILIIMGVV